MSTMFAWDETKRLATLKKHGIDFIDAVEIFADTYLKLPGKGDAERRYIAIGMLGGAHIAVVYTVRNGMIRLITARRARRDERKDFRALYSGGNPADEGQD
ncbi:BrnT family toxin [Paracoccus subflavus]|uniref:BrnT family toxin n=1 Tax=Paracoccus subflavus TaxID=2528244 RepID=A0A4Q9G0E0_9RHOB|nr:BrnT family toxin [Paracoccus subflavus]